MSGLSGISKMLGVDYFKSFAKPKRRVNKTAKHVKFSEKRVFLPRVTYTYVYISWSKKCPFFGKFRMLCFPVIFVLRFAFLPYYHRFLYNILSKQWRIQDPVKHLWGSLSVKIIVLAAFRCELFLQKSSTIGVWRSLEAESCRFV